MQRSISFKTDFLSSKFTRKKGFTDIQGSISLSRKKAIQILNSFTPQGASPDKSIRIGTHEDYLGIGYYEMENASTANLHTMLFSFDDRKYKKITKNLLRTLQNSTSDAIIIANNIREDEETVMDLKVRFGEAGLAILLYSLLSGDNMIIAHESHEERIDFIFALLSLIPAIILKYTRVTSDCYELDGNENIIGVSTLPNKYKSHTKLFLPLDSIFVDIKTGKIEGNGIKSSTFTKRMSEIYDISNEDVFYQILSFIEKCIERDKHENLDDSSNQLAGRIYIKYHQIKPPDEGWLAEF